MRAQWVLAATLASCAGDESSVLDSDITVWFAIGFDAAAGKRLSILDAAPVRFPFKPDSSETQLGLIGVPEGLFLGLRPYANPDALERSRIVELGTAECVDGELDFESGLLHYSLETRPEVMGLRLDGSELVAANPGAMAEGLSLEVPIGERECVSLGVARPFGATLELLPKGIDICGRSWRDNAEESNFHQLDWIEEASADRWLAASNRALYDFRRGQPYSEDPSRTICWGELATVLGLHDWQFRDFAIDRSDPSRVFLTGIHRFGGALVEAVLGDSGLTLVRTATITSQGLLTVDIDEFGLTAVGGRQGLVLTATSPRGRFTRTSVGTFDVVSTKVSSTSKIRFLLGGGGERVLVGRGLADSPELEIIEVGTDPLRSIRSVEVRDGPEGTEGWAVSSGNVKLLGMGAQDARWTEVPVEYPPVSPGCGGPVICGRNAGIKGARSVQVSDGKIVVLTECGLLVGFDPEGNCSSALDLELSAGSLISATLGSARTQDGVAVSGDWGLLLHVAP